MSQHWWKLLRDVGFDLAPKRLTIVGNLVLEIPTSRWQKQKSQMVSIFGMFIQFLFPIYQSLEPLEHRWINQKPNFGTVIRQLYKTINWTLTVDDIDSRRKTQMLRKNMKLISFEPHPCFPCFKVKNWHATLLLFFLHVLFFHLVFEPHYQSTDLRN